MASGYDMLDYDSLGAHLEPQAADQQPMATAWQPQVEDNWPAAPEPTSEEFDRYPRRPVVRPLILVGGFAANGLSQLEVSGQQRFTGQQVWPPFHFHPGSGDWRIHGVAEVNQAGLAPTGLVIGQYEPLLLFLEQELGYQPGRDFFVFPYRWTESNRVTGQRLAGFIEKVISDFPWAQAQERRVDVICHSMGGLATRAAGLLYRAPLGRVVYLACPFFGAGKGYLNLHPSHSVQVVDNMLLNRIIDWLAPEVNPIPGGSSALTECFQQMDSLYELLPDRIGFERGLCPVGLRARLNSPATPIASWQEVYLKEPSTAFPAVLHGRIEKAMEFKELLADRMPGQAYLTLYSASHSTVGRVDLAFGFSRFTVFGTPYDANGGGDGSVPAASGRGPGPALEVHGRHLAVPNHRTSFYWIARFLALAPT